MYSRLPEWLLAHPPATSAAAKITSRQSFDMPKF